MSKLKFILGVDTEGDFYYYVPSPHFNLKEVIKWKLNSLAGRLFRYARPGDRGIKNLITTLKSYKFPTSFLISGHLYLKECNGYPHFNEKAPENPWYHRWIGKNWYYWDNPKKKIPGFYFGEIIEKELKNNKLFSLGLHAFGHEALTLETKEVNESIVNAGLMAAAKIGIKPDAFAAPFEMIEDEQEPNKIFDILRNKGIKKIFYAGKDNGFQRKRYFQATKIINREGLKLIWISNYFEGSFSKRRIAKIIEQIKSNVGKDVTYCLMTHDFTHKNTKNLEIIIKAIRQLEKENKLEILSINNLK